jgi:protein-disulfide isomerase
MKRYLPFAIVAAVFLIVAGAGAWLFYSHAPRARSTSKIGPPGAEPAHIRGAKDARVTLEEFGDFECPPCGNLSPVLDKLEEDFAKELRLVFREFPMPAHKHALRAASACEAAGLQNRFWEMHDLLYRERFAWPHAVDVEKLFVDYATQLKLNVDLFKKDIDSEKVKARIAADQERGRSLHVDRTPTMFINDELVPVTSFSPDGLRKAIEEAAKAKPR